MITVIDSYHEDWVVNLLLSNGEVFTFVTEMWPEHGFNITSDNGGDNWPAVMREAENRALFLAARHAEPFCRICLDTEREIWRTRLNDIAMEMTDVTFRRLMRH
jgi:hypothetical protein